MREHQTVMLLEDFPGKGLRKGDIGGIVHVYEEHKAYEVEFVSSDGQTVAMLPLTAEQIREAES